MKKKQKKKFKNKKFGKKTNQIEKITKIIEKKKYKNFILFYNPMVKWTNFRRLQSFPCHILFRTSFLKTV